MQALSALRNPNICRKFCYLNRRCPEICLCIEFDRACHVNHSYTLSHSDGRGMHPSSLERAHVNEIREKSGAKVMLSVAISKTCITIVNLKGMAKYPQDLDHSHWVAVFREQPSYFLHFLQ
jgi:hypothetical protein